MKRRYSKQQIVNLNVHFKYIQKHNLKYKQSQLNGSSASLVSHASSSTSTATSGHEKITIPIRKSTYLDSLYAIPL